MLTSTVNDLWPAIPSIRDSHFHRTGRRDCRPLPSGSHPELTNSEQQFKWQALREPSFELQ